MLWFENPYGEHGLRIDSALSRDEAEQMLATGDRRRIGNGSGAFQLRIKVRNGDVKIQPWEAGIDDPRN
ncbi:MAG TPA: hypothetical protein VH063_04630 [Gaiellaceae bacterium]|jgi:hypothetical protein|nr:hypothetical protein [Gaiellaceae bacterium]